MIMNSDAAECNTKDFIGLSKHAETHSPNTSLKNQ